ncbi:unnamed protein product [Paramecium octaurelia]|uniref:Transmembrane protein n=1 Tax=Paramecium octaurelia TaxID=43137 RepID=A0A8S1VXT1_PAROT|nr:unnamed protein product [Paramecium octaurelia]
MNCAFLPQFKHLIKKQDENMGNQRNFCINIQECYIDEYKVGRWDKWFNQCGHKITQFDYHQIFLVMVDCLMKQVQIQRLENELIILKDLRMIPKQHIMVHMQNETTKDMRYLISCFESCREFDLPRKLDKIDYIFINITQIFFPINQPYLKLIQLNLHAISNSLQVNKVIINYRILRYLQLLILIQSSQPIIMKLFVIKIRNFQFLNLFISTLKLINMILRRDYGVIPWQIYGYNSYLLFLLQNTDYYYIIRIIQYTFFITSLCCGGLTFKYLCHFLTNYIFLQFDKTSPFDLLDFLPEFQQLDS